MGLISGGHEMAYICIKGECVDRVPSFMFVGVHTDADLQWCSNASTVVKKAQQRLHLLRILRRIDLKLLTVFYRCSIESALRYRISVWFPSRTMAHKKAQQRVVNSAQKIIGHPLPSLKDLDSTRRLRRARSTHPGRREFQLLKTRTNRLRDGFYNRATAPLHADM